MINTYSSESIFESVRFLNEDKENFNILMELTDIQRKANKNNCYLVLEAFDIKKILDWIIDKWNKFLSFIRKKHDAFLRFISNLKNESNFLKKALDYCKKNDSTFETNEKYFVYDIDLEKALDILNCFEANADASIKTLVKNNNEKLYNQDIISSFASSVLKVKDCSNNINDFNKKYEELINYGNDKKIHIKDKYKEMELYNLTDIEKFLNSIEKKNQLRKKEIDVLSKNLDNTEAANDHFMAYTNLANIELKMYTNIAHCLSQYSAVVCNILNSMPDKKDNNNNNLSDFINCIKSDKLLKTRIMMKDSLIIDRTFSMFNEMNSIVKKENPRLYNKLYDKYDEEPFEANSSKWNIDYMNKQLVKVVNNFCHERIDHLKDVITSIYKN